MAQLIERGSNKPVVLGSSASVTTSFLSLVFFFLLLLSLLSIVRDFSIACFSDQRNTDISFVSRSVRVVTDACVS